jgi:hypothetical protein
MKKTMAKSAFVVVAAVAVLAAVPAVAQPVSPCLGGGQIGTCPGWVDMNGNGVWDTGVDQLITFSFSAVNSMLTIVNPWSTNCGDAVGNQVYFDSSTGCGFTHAYRVRGDNYSAQNMFITTQSGGFPIQFSFLADMVGTGTLMPVGGPYSSLQLTGALNMLVGPFQGVDASGGHGAYNHITIPWALSSALGMNGACKIASIDPQIFLPVVPGTDPGTFQLVPSFAGMCSSPELMLAAWTPFGNIPTLGEWGLIALILGVGLVGWGLLRRSGVLA